ncbi:MAG: hypothetical protein IPL52_15205 [Flavobacteriales bacterium]|nr:hypothetical protein [Flavobacteriales bacterium]
MKHLFTAALIIALSSAATAQWQINPQVGATFQQITKAPDGITYAARAGVIGGADFRFGDRLFVQPGAFLGRNATYLQVADSAVSSGRIFRTNLKLKLLGGYRVVDSYQFDIRISLGPTYERVLDRNVKDTDIELDDDDFNDGLWSLDGAVGFDIGRFTLEPGASVGMSRIYNDNVAVQNINSRYVTYTITFGVNIGDDDKDDLPATP